MSRVSYSTVSSTHPSSFHHNLLMSVLLAVVVPSANGCDPGPVDTKGGQGEHDATGIYDGSGGATFHANESTGSGESSGSSENGSTGSSESEGNTAGNTGNTGATSNTGFAPQDGFDPFNNRWVLRSNDSSTLVGVDMQTGDETVIVQSWPWPETHSTYIDDFALDQGAEHIYAFVTHSYFDQTMLSCVEKEYVSIDAIDGSVLPIDQLNFECCDDCGGGRYRTDPVIDVAHNSLRYLDANCDPDGCDHYARDWDPDTATLNSSHYLYDSYCDWNDPEVYCNMDTLWNERPLDITVDPRADTNMLLLMREGTLLSLDHGEGSIDTEVEIPADWDEVSLDLSYYKQWLQLDYEQRRAFVTLKGTFAYATIQVDLDSEELSMVYGGDMIMGTQLGCVDAVAFDTLHNRILYRNKASVPKNCVAGFYAVDIQSGVAEKLFEP